ncbi:30S ribosomal protein S20 [Mycoplasma sp. E35C]|uniref:30S ribosomal protein S20 n=1 Tax=Mycoplasma sp. E35C TaxID=2801918 RepID=UPI001CA38D08|nr:30S ribosomal protein S20 [Mycoplasma sp. E35C]QZX49242.1 30S ribosomal protein S20 [Mycoplasma sp. E35C]
MANIKANEKSYRQNQKANLLTKGFKTALKNQIKKTKVSKDKKDADKIYSLADKLAKNSRISKNKARRIKSKAARWTNAQAASN